MMYFLRVLLNTIFPERSDAKIVRFTTREKLHRIVQPVTHEGCVSLLPMSDQSVRACIHEMKYCKNERAIALLSSVLERYITQHKDALVIPIPLSPKRKTKRGYNQMELVLNAISEKINISNDILYRVKDTKPQTSLNKSDRKENMRDAFALYETEDVAEQVTGKALIICDDVMTTGATLKAAEATLLPLSPASITLLSIAH